MSAFGSQVALMFASDVQPDAGREAGAATLTCRIRAFRGVRGGWSSA